MVPGGQEESLGEFPNWTSFLEEVMSDKEGLEDIIGKSLAKVWRLERRSEAMAGGTCWRGPNATVGFGDQNHFQGYTLGPQGMAGAWIPLFPMPRYLQDYPRSPMSQGEWS